MPPSGRKSPKLWRRVDGCGPELFSFDDAVKGAEAGLLDNAAVADGAQAEEGRWVAEKAGASSADDLRRALAKGTVFFNGAGLAFPNLAALGAACHRFLGLPANINVYVTDPRREISVSPHSDAQNVLVFPGVWPLVKRWRVDLAAAATRWRNNRTPFGRGKGGDPRERGPFGRGSPCRGLGEPVVDVTLRTGRRPVRPTGLGPRDVDGGQRRAELPRDAGRRHVLLRPLLVERAVDRAGAQQLVGDDVDPGALDEATFSRLYGAVPVGFLRPQSIKDEAWLDYFVKELRALQDDVKGASPLGDEASLKDLAPST